MSTPDNIITIIEPGMRVYYRQRVNGLKVNGIVTTILRHRGQPSLQVSRLCDGRAVVVDVHQVVSARPGLTVVHIPEVVETVPEPVVSVSAPAPVIAADSPLARVMEEKSAAAAIVRDEPQDVQAPFVRLLPEGTTPVIGDKVRFFAAAGGEAVGRVVEADDTHVLIVPCHGGMDELVEMIDIIRIIAAAPLVAA